VYAPGTYQNVPAVGRRLYRGTPGRYLYRGKVPGLDPGEYRLRVTAADVCGNTGSLSIPITVVERTGPPPAPAPLPVPAPAPSWQPFLTAHPAPSGAGSWPSGVTAYAVVLASLPATDVADSVASGAVAAKLPSVGVLESSSFASLAPGYRVVFSGVYQTAAEAE